MARTPRSFLVALLPFLIAVLIVPSSKAAAQGGQAWQLVEVVDYNKQPGGDYSLGYARGAVTWSWKLNGDAWAFAATWSAPPETIRPSDRVTIDFQVVTTADVGDQYSAGGSFAMFFDRPEVEPGSAVAPIGFTNDKGEGGGVDVRHRVRTPPVGRTVWLDGATLGAGRPGGRIALIVAVYNGRNAGTKYVYEWRGPLTPEEKEALGPPAPQARPLSRPPPSPAPPLNGMRDSGARFSSMTGTVEVYHEGESPKAARFARRDTILYVGDHVLTREESSAIIGEVDLQTFLMKEESEIVIAAPPEKDSKIGLVLGTVWTNVKKMWKDGTMEVEMWDAAASVKGTTFVCETSPAGSTIKVIEGTVAVRSKKRPQAVTLTAGTMVTSTGAGLGPVRAFSTAAESASWDAIRKSGND